MPEQRKRPESWRVRRADVPRWSRPFHAAEWAIECMVYRLSRWAFLEFLGYVGRFVIVVSIASAAYSYVFKRSEQLENLRKQKHYQAWQVINSAEGKGGSGGRIDALQDLVRDGVSLMGVNLEAAWLIGADLQNADLRYANLYRAVLESAILKDADLTRARFSYLSYADLSDANLTGASLGGAHLYRADLTGANLHRANLSYADLSDANLNHARIWRSIVSIKFANVHDVKNAPEGFLAWADSMGAVSIAFSHEWEAMVDSVLRAQKN